MQLGLFNHSSWVDAVVMMWLFAPSGVSKESNAHLPLIGTCIKAFQNIYVPRGKAAKTPTISGKSVSHAIADRWDCAVLCCAVLHAACWCLALGAPAAVCSLHALACIAAGPYGMSMTLPLSEHAFCNLTAHDSAQRPQDVHRFLHTLITQ